MSTQSAARTATAALFVAAAGLARASEAAVEGQGELGGPRALFYLLAGVAALGVVIWLMVKFLNR